MMPYPEGLTWKLKKITPRWPSANTTTRELRSAVKKLKNRSNNEVRDAAGVDTEALNRHYART